MKMGLLLMTLVLSIVIGCSENPSQEEETNTSVFPYPKTVSEVKADSSYIFYYTGEKSGIQYYVKEIPTEELNKYSGDDLVHEYAIVGPEKSWVCVPVKDDQIVKVDINLLGDLTAIGMKVTLEDEEAKQKNP